MPAPRRAPGTAAVAVLVTVVMGGVLAVAVAGVLLLSPGSPTAGWSTAAGSTSSSSATSAAPPTSSPPVQSPTVTSGPPPATATPAPSSAIVELLANPRLQMSSQARQSLLTHPVDLRLAALLVQLGATTTLSVLDVPAPDGAGDGTEPLRTVVLDGIGGQPVGADPALLTDVLHQLSAQDAPYRAQAQQQERGDTTVLQLALPPAGT